MAPQNLKNVIVAGATGTIGAPITAALLSAGFTVSALSRPDSKATFPTGVTVKTADLSSHASLVEALAGQDVVITTLNDAAAELQPGIIEAAYEAGVKRFFPNEWAKHEMVVTGTPLEDMKAGKAAIFDLLNAKVEQAKGEGKEFHWTAVDNGTFFDWALYASFLDISLPPTRTAKIWDGGNTLTTLTTLSTVAKAVIASLTTAEEATRDKLLTIQSFVASQNEIVAALEKATGETWNIENTTREEEIRIGHDELEKGEFLNALYRWIKAAIFGDDAVLEGVQNELLGLEKETLDEVVAKVVKGEQV